MVELKYQLDSSTRERSKICKLIRKNMMVSCILISIVFGFILGVGLRQVEWKNSQDVLWFTLPGRIFIRSLQMFIIPVVFFGIVSSTSSQNIKTNLHVTVASLILTLLSHTIATLTGLCGSLVYVMVNLISKHF